MMQTLLSLLDFYLNEGGTFSKMSGDMMQSLAEHHSGRTDLLVI